MSRETPLDVWSWDEQNQSRADALFATTSVDNVEFDDDLEPKAYRDTRAVMELNRAIEMAELERRYPGFM